MSAKELARTLAPGDLRPFRGLLGAARYTRQRRLRRCFPTTCPDAVFVAFFLDLEAFAADSACSAAAFAARSDAHRLR